eukprot:TRINITY_DN4825_c0_g1_i1.p2 TRINITY_DN4825_c0_g1~~TRINITY_DN4825_c0_g1_i1.p2  ORF type:complete len:227 (+),score=41.25 TRINITY_DN4825_c0_g1_i1:53-733(+)
MEGLTYALVLSALLASAAARDCGSLNETQCNADELCTYANTECSTRPCADFNETQCGDASLCTLKDGKCSTWACSLLESGKCNLAVMCEMNDGACTSRPCNDLNVTSECPTALPCEVKDGDDETCVERPCEELKALGCAEAGPRCVVANGVCAAPTPPGDGDEGSGATAVEYLIFYLTYFGAMAAGIFGVKTARKHGYCKEPSLKEKAGEKLDFAKKGFLGGGGSN